MLVSTIRCSRRAYFRRLIFSTVLTLGSLPFFRCVMNPELPQSPPGIHQIRIWADSARFDSLIDRPNSDKTVSCVAIALLGSEEHTLKAGIQIHGGSSRRYPKKSFLLDFEKPHLSSSRLFGQSMNNADETTVFKKIILNAQVIDQSYLRNYVSLFLARSLGVLTPRHSFADLYINNSYYGLYAVIEQVDEDWGTAYFHHPFIDLLKADNHNANFKPINHYFGSGRGPAFFSNDSVVAPETGFEIKNGNPDVLRSLEVWLESKGAAFDSIARLTTPKSIYAYFLSTLYCGNTDGGMSKNYYFLDDRITGKFEFIPWDCDATFGRDWNGAPASSPSLDELVALNGLFEHLYRNTEWPDTLRRLYKERFRAALAPQPLLDEILRLEPILSESVARDARRWGPTMSRYFEQRGSYPWSDLPADSYLRWKADVDAVKSFIANRLESLDGQIFGN